MWGSRAQGLIEFKIGIVELDTGATGELEDGRVVFTKERTRVVVSLDALDEWRIVLPKLHELLGRAQ